MSLKLKHVVTFLKITIYINPTKSVQYDGEIAESLLLDVKCSNDDTIYSVIVCFCRGQLGVDPDHVDEITERCFSVFVEDGLHLPPSVADRNAFQSRLVLDQTTFLVFGHGRYIVLAVGDESGKPVDFAS